MSTRIRTDWALFGAAMLVLAFGLVMVYSASSVVAEVRYNKQTWEFAARQLIAALIGITLMLLLKRLDYRKLQHPLWVFVPIGITIMLLIGVLFADAKAHRWYRVPGLGQFQPSELAKPVLILFLAWFVARRESLINSRYTIIPTALVVGGLTMLIGLGDLGTAAVLLTPAIVVFFVAGIERRYFYFTLALVFLLGICFVFQKPYRIIRVTSFFGLTEEVINTTPKYHWLAVQLASTKANRDADHQPRQSKIAVGSGGLTGAGLGQSNQKLGFLPEAHTDFIFSVISEETGLVGCVLLLSTYMFIFWRGLRLFWLTADPFGRYIALGCVALVTAQALFNMSVVLDMAPTKGIPLPLISFGGTALICTLATFGLLMSVSDRAS
ncbi:MAG: cell division protein FtsW [Acidobacteria bacterium]|nr:cell division protein FtsW [Acidobacteriota bacterium]